MHPLFRQSLYIVERYRVRVMVGYVLLTIGLTLQLVLTLQRTHASSQTNAVYQPPSYPIINKLAVPVSAQVSSAAVSTAGSIWPIHGRITTEFGVYHRPWQATHTGLDISSAQPSGVTPVLAFRSGVVTQVIHSGVSFGNHVIIDNGGGLTSLYGHMASTSVSVGQMVNAGDMVGREGNTGASTGTHLHFETQLNGQPVSPRRFLSGSP